jgi:predicted molibdopterin-dependent oxidoreductase YjgC
MQEFTISFDGRECQGREGQTIAEILMTNGVTTFRYGPDGSPHGLYCGMGECFQCRVILNGKRNVRACKTLAKSGDVVQTQKDAECGVA